MSTDILQNKEFQKKQKYKESKFKRNSYLGTGIFLLFVLIIYAYNFYYKMPKFLFIMTCVFLIVIIIAFFYDGYRKHKSLQTI